MKFFIPLILVICLVVGCNDGPNETSHPMFIKYRKALNSQKYPDAAEHLRRYLKVRPDSCAGHLAMATLCDEKFDDQLGAIYHYKQVLEIEPHSRQCKDVEEWLRNAEKRYYLKAKNKYNDPEDVAALQNTLYEAENMLKLAQNENRRQAVLVSERRQKIVQLEHELKMNAIEATDVSILKEQLRECNTMVNQLEVYRSTLTRSEKEKENRLQELREAMKGQNIIIEDFRAKLEISQKENQKSAQNLTELRQQLKETVETLAETSSELETLRVDSQKTTTKKPITKEDDHVKTTLPTQNKTVN